MRFAPGYFENIVVPPFTVAKPRAPISAVRLEGAQELANQPQKPYANFGCKTDRQSAFLDQRNHLVLGENVDAPPPPHFVIQAVQVLSVRPQFVDNSLNAV